MNKIAIIGGGSWATSLIKIITDKGLKANWWIRQPENIELIKKYRHNPNYLSYVTINTDLLNITTNFKEASNDVDILIWAIPAAYFKETTKDFEFNNLQNKFHISAAKGIIPELNITLTDYMQNYMQIPLSNIGMIAGPCHAEEVAMEKRSHLTIATSNQTISEAITDIFSNHYISISSSNDLIGIEYAAILKNIFAICVGIATGIGYGDNYLALLTVEAVKETKRFLEAICPTKRDVISSVYLGDIIVTCYSQFSRNRVFGTMIGRGYTPKHSMIELKMVVEGYFATKGIREKVKQLQIDMPIVEAVYNILYESTPPKIEIMILNEKILKGI